MPNPQGFPADLRASLAQGSDDTLDRNSVRFLAKLKEPRDHVKDWNNGFRRLNLKTMTAFELSTRLAWLVEEISASTKLSANGQKTADDMERVVIVLNAEYMILKHTSTTPLRQHPFLLHWVTAYDSIREDLQTNRDRLGTSEYSSQEVFLKSRLEFIYFALKGLEDFTGVEDWPEKHVGTMTPLALMEHTVELDAEPEGLDLTPYATILNDVGVALSWELAALLPDPSIQTLERGLVDLGPNEYSPASEKAPAPTTPITTPFEPTLAEIEKYILIDPGKTVHLLTRLDGEIPSLNLLTQLAAKDNHILASVGADKTHVILEYIEHSLRTIEKLGQDDNHDSYPDVNEPVRDKEKQEKLVKLLVMFIKNLLMEDLVKFQDILMEIKEICVRYIFIREVREFRAWLQGENEQAQPQRQYGSRMGG